MILRQTRQHRTAQPGPEQCRRVLRAEPGRVGQSQVNSFGNHARMVAERGKRNTDRGQ